MLIEIKCVLLKSFLLYKTNFSTGKSKLISPMIQRIGTYRAIQSLSFLSNRSKLFLIVIFKATSLICFCFEGYFWFFCWYDWAVKYYLNLIFMKFIGLSYPFISPFPFGFTQPFRIIVLFFGFTILMFQDDFFQLLTQHILLLSNPW